MNEKTAFLLGYRAVGERAHRRLFLAALAADIDNMADGHKRLVRQAAQEAKDAAESEARHAGDEAIKLHLASAKGRIWIVVHDTNPVATYPTYDAAVEAKELFETGYEMCRDLWIDSIPNFAA